MVYGCSSPLELAEATCFCAGTWGSSLLEPAVLLSVWSYLQYFLQMPPTPHIGRIWWAGALHWYFHFFLFILACKLWLYSVSLMSFQQGGPRSFCLSSHGSCSIPSLNLLQLQDAFSQVQRPEPNARCLIVLYSNVFKYHVFSALPNDTQCFIAFLLLLLATALVGADDFRENSQQWLRLPPAVGTAESVSGKCDWGIAQKIFP